MKKPFKMVQESEPRRFPQRYFDLLDRVAARIEPDERGLAEWFSNYRRQHRARLAGDLEIIEHHVAPGGRILECGSVPLLATAALAELGYRVSGIDIAPERFATAIERLSLDIRKCDVEKEPLPYAAETFDGVVFNELFEHLRINPIATVREVGRVLKNEGILLLSTPNLRSFRGIRNLVFRHRGAAASGGIYQQYEKLAALGHMGHVREYTVREVADFLARVGFRVPRVVYRGGHGRGPVGLAERLAPSLRPFFSLVAVKESEG